MAGRFDAVQPGMTADEVENILGEPNPDAADEFKTWTGNWGAIFVDFDGGRVSKKEFLPIHPNHFPHRSGP
jgi:hypothetical protein